MAIMEGGTSKAKEIGLTELSNKTRCNLQDLANLITGTLNRAKPEVKPPTDVPVSPCNPIDEIHAHLISMNNLIDEMRQFFNDQVAFKL